MKNKKLVALALGLAFILMFLTLYTIFKLVEQNKSLNERLEDTISKSTTQIKNLTENQIVLQNQIKSIYKNDPKSGENGINGLNGRNGRNGINGKDAKNGSSCSTIQNQNGAIIKCSDGTKSVIKNGKDVEIKIPYIQCNILKNRWEIRYDPTENWQIMGDMPIPCTVVNIN